MTTIQVSITETKVVDIPANFPIYRKHNCGIQYKILSKDKTISVSSTSVSQYYTLCGYESNTEASSHEEFTAKYNEFLTFITPLI